MFHVKPFFFEKVMEKMNIIVYNRRVTGYIRSSFIHIHFRRVGFWEKP